MGLLSISPLYMGYEVNNICFSQVKPRTLKWLVHPILNLTLPPQTASSAGMMFASPNSKFISRFRWKQLVLYTVYFNLICWPQSFRRAQQCSVSHHCLGSGTEHFVHRGHPTQEDEEETEAQGAEKSGKEEGEAEAKTSDTFRSSWTGEWLFIGPDSGEKTGYPPLSLGQICQPTMHHSISLL